MAGKSGKLKLYYCPMYRSFRSVWLVKELGVEDDVDLIRYKPGADKAADDAYRKDVHPHGTIPALVIPGEPPILESGAICMYLADRYGKLVPEPKNRRDYYNFIMYANCTVDAIMEFFFETSDEVKPEAEIEKWKDKFNTSMVYLAKRLEGKEYICGEFTAADCVLGFMVVLSSMFKDGELLKNHPTILQYVARIKARPAFKETFEMK